MYMVLCAVSVIKLTDRLIADKRQYCPSALFLLAYILHCCCIYKGRKLSIKKAPVCY